MNYLSQNVITRLGNIFRGFSFLAMTTDTMTSFLALFDDELSLTINKKIFEDI